MDQKVEETEVRAGSTHARFTKTGAAGPQTGECSMRFSQDTNTNAVDCQMGTPDPTLGVLSIHLIVLPEGVFLQYPATIQAKFGSLWLKSNSASKDPAAQGMLKVQEDMKKSAEVKEFMPPTGRITATADEQLDGTPVTRYEITAAIAAAAKQATDPKTQGEFAELIEKGIQTVQSTVWLDAQNRPLKLRSTLPLSKLDKNGVIDVVKEVTFDHWGEAVLIAAPPADQVTLFPKH